MHGSVAELSCRTELNTGAEGVGGGIGGGKDEKVWSAP